MFTVQTTTSVSYSAFAKTRRYILQNVCVFGDNFLVLVSEIIATSVTLAVGNFTPNDPVDNRCVPLVHHDERSVPTWCWKWPTKQTMVQ